LFKLVLFICLQLLKLLGSGNQLIDIRLPQP
jgi:hypothetical protein